MNNSLMLLSCFKKSNDKISCNACETSAAYTGGALHIRRRQMLHTAKPCFIRSAFTRFLPFYCYRLHFFEG